MNYAAVLTTLVAMVMLLWWRAGTIRRWERETELWNAWSGCHMSVEEYRAWMTQR